MSAEKEHRPTTHRSRKQREAKRLIQWINCHDRSKQPDLRTSPGLILRKLVVMDDCCGLVEVVSHLETDPVTVHQMCLPRTGEEIFSGLQSNKVELSSLIVLVVPSRFDKSLAEVIHVGLLGVVQCGEEGFDGEFGRSVLTFFICARSSDLVAKPAVTGRDECVLDLIHGQTGA